MYVGILSESGKRVHDADAFSYACERIGGGTDTEKTVFMEYARGAESFEEFETDLVEWFYSGNWIYQKESEEN